LDYANRVIKLEIYVSAAWKLKPRDAARFYAHLYRRAHPELEEALAFDARLIYETDPDNPTGVTKEQQIRKLRGYNRHDPDVATMTDEEILALMAFARMTAPDVVKEKLSNQRHIGLIDI